MLRFSAIDYNLNDLSLYNHSVTILYVFGLQPTHIGCNINSVFPYFLSDKSKVTQRPKHTPTDLDSIYKDITRGAV